MSAPDMLATSRGRYVYDTETNGFLAVVTEMHCAVMHDIDTDEVFDFGPTEKILAKPATYPLSKFLEMYQSATTLIGHNIISFDGPVIEKLYGITPSPSCQIIDTLNLAKLVFSDIKASDFKLAAAWKKFKAEREAWVETARSQWEPRDEWDVFQEPAYPYPPPKEFPGQFVGRHSLEAWGYRMGTERKGEYTDWCKDRGIDPWAEWRPEMHDYMIQDAVVNVALYRHLLTFMPSEQSMLLEMRVQALCGQMERNGWPLNVKGLEELYATLTAERAILAQELRTLFPPWTVQLDDFIPKRDNKTKGYLKGVPVERFETVEFNPASRQHIERCLREKYDWKPTEFTPAGQAVVDDDVLTALPYPEAQKLARFFMVQKRIGQIAEGDKAWLKFVTKEGKIHGRYNTNGTVTGRMAHFDPNLGQVPAVGKEYGRDCRACFTVPDGWVQVGSDQSGLELRCLGSYLFGFDGGAYIEIVLNGDIHWENAKVLFGLPKDTVRDEENFPEHKHWRGIAKTFIYAFLYGAGPEKLGFTVGVTPEERKAWLVKDTEHYRSLLWIRKRLRERGGNPTRDQLLAIYKGERLTDQFLKGFPALGKLLKVVKKAAKKKWLAGLDGRKIPVRSEHAALNSLLQSAGAVICKTWFVEAEQALLAMGLKHGWDGDFVLLGLVHDEAQWAFRKGVDLEAAQAAIIEAGRRAGDPYPAWKCPLDVETKVGTDWATCH